MRRSIDKSILVTAPPKKKKLPYRRKEHYKTKQKRCNELEILLQDYKKQSGENFNIKEIAYRCSVSPNTARRWFYGFCPNHLIWWNIARYFALYLPVTAEVIHADIKATIDEWRSAK